MSLYFVSIYTAFRSEQGYTLSTSMKNVFEYWPINADGSIYAQVKNKVTVNQFIYNAIMTQIFNEDIKDYYPLVDGYHYLTVFNYAAGVRITYNRIKLENTEVLDFKNIKVRQANYEDGHDIIFENVETKPFGTDEVEYQPSGGYQGKGGYVFYFRSNLTYEEMLDKYTQMVRDGFYDKNWLSIIVEIMIYNANFQTGIIIAYEFLLNNAGDLIHNKNIDAFYMSRYYMGYTGNSRTTENVLIFLDVLFCSYYLLFWFQFIKRIKIRLYELCKLRHNSFTFVDCLEFCIICLIFIWLVFWTLVFWFPPTIDFPVNDISDFEKYRELADKTTSFSIVSSITTLVILMRWLIYMTECYPAFGALFSTLKVAFKDLATILVTMSIIIMGFFYASYYMFGSQQVDNHNILAYAWEMILQLKESVSLTDTTGRIDNKTLYSIFYIVFLFLFSFIFLKLLISVIIVRYLYLRSSVHFENEVKANVLNEK